MYKYVEENDDLKENEELIDYFIAGGLMTAINILLKYMNILYYNYNNFFL